MPFKQGLGRIGLVVLLGCLAAPAAQGASPKEERANAHPRVLVVIAPVAFHEGELKSVRTGLVAKQVQVIVGSTQAGEAKGMVQEKVHVDCALEQIQPEQVDGLIIIGGSGAKMYLWFNEELKRLVTGLNKLHRPIGAIAIAPGALAYAGVLKGRRATVLPAPETLKLFERQNVKMTNEDVTVDGNLVTTSTTSGAPGLTQAFIRLLPAKSRARAWELAPAASAPKPKAKVGLPARKPSSVE